MYTLLSIPHYTENLLAYDDVDADVLQCYHEMTLANLLYHAMKEGACSEQSSRMTAMDSASKNAGEWVAVMERRLRQNYGRVYILFSNRVIT